MIKKIYNTANKILLQHFKREIIKTRPKEAIIFAKKHFKKKEITAAEIGVYAGENSEDMNKELNIKTFYLIDPYENYEGYKNDSLSTKLQKAKKEAHKKNKKKNITWIEQTSEKAATTIKEELDMTYIDGNHEYEYVKKDLELYWPKIKKGGLLAGHDIQAKGVSKALIEFTKKYDLEPQFGDRRDWWIIKK